MTQSFSSPFNGFRKLGRRRAGAGVSVANQTATFGALTRAGAGGYQIVAGGAPVTNCTNAGGGTATGFTLTTGGLLTPTANDGFAAQNGNTINITCNQGTATITLSVEANAYTVRNGTEFEALDAIAAATLAGKTIRLRRRTTADLQTAWDGARFRFIEPATKLTIRGDDATTPVWELQFTECANIEVRDLTFAADWLIAGDEAAPMLQFSGNAVGTGLWNKDITVRDCTFRSTVRDPVGADAWKQRRGLRITDIAGAVNERIRVFGNTFEDVYTGVTVIGGTDIVIHSNTFESVFADCCSASVGQAVWNITVRDNFFGEQTAEAGRDYSGNGGPNDPHAGKIEFNHTSWAANSSGIYVYRNISNNTGAYYSGNSVSVKDLASPYYVSNVEVSGNIFQQFNGGILLSRCDGAVVRYNTVSTNLNDLTGNTRIDLTNCINSTASHNCSGALTDTGGTGNTLANNFTLAETATAYNNAFDGDFTGNAMPARNKAATVAAYEPQIAGSLDTVPQIGAGWFDDYTNQTSTYPSSLSPFDIVHISAATDLVDASVYTFAGIDVGAAPSGGDTVYTIVTVESVDTSAAQITGVTCNGNAMTEIVKSGATTSYAGIYLIAHPADLTPDIVVTIGGTTDGCRINTYRMVNPASATPTDTATALINGSTPLTLDLDIASGGKAVGCLAARSTVPVPTLSWVGLTAIGSPVDLSNNDFCQNAIGGSAGTPHAVSTANTGTFQSQAAAVASWGP
jgi:hypothetical protein